MRKDIRDQDTPEAIMFPARVRQTMMACPSIAHPMKYPTRHMSKCKDDKNFT